MKNSKMQSKFLLLLLLSCSITLGSVIPIPRWGLGNEGPTPPQPTHPAPKAAPTPQPAPVFLPTPPAAAPPPPPPPPPPETTSVTINQCVYCGSIGGHDALVLLLTVS